MIRRRMWFRIALVVTLITATLVIRNQVKVYRNRQLRAEQATSIESNRKALFDLLQPEVLANCELERFGEPHDGGYLLCANLLANAQAGYSYGISGYDQWGCDVSTKLKVRVHQYDCFNTEQPTCPGEDTSFMRSVWAPGRRSMRGGCSTR